MRALILELSHAHLGYFGCYGNDWIATPSLDGLAAEGVVFDQHIAGCLAVSHSIWTGCYHFPLTGPSPLPQVGEGPDLMTLCRSHGVPFYHVNGRRKGKSQPENLGTSLKQTVAAALKVLTRIGSLDSWLTWVDLPSLQPPWRLPDKHLARYLSAVAENQEEGEAPLVAMADPPPGCQVRDDFCLWEQVQLTYAGVVSYMDAVLGSFLQELAACGLGEELLLVVTAEEGLALGEHGVIGDNPPWLHDELVHLPLILRFPGCAEAGRRVSALTQPVDLLPTILEAFGLPIPKCHGSSLLPLARGEVAQVRSYACSGAGQGGAIEWALRTNEWAFLLPVALPPQLETRRPQLYVKPDDRWEVNDVSQHHQELAGHLELVLKGFVAATCRPGPLEPPALHPKTTHHSV
jgi:arylsulfatase A-like enzyme